MQTLTYSVIGVFILLTLLPLVRVDIWWVRIFEFPRLQTAILGCLAVILAALVLDAEQPLVQGTLIILLSVFIFQVLKIAPFTPFYRKQLKNARNVDESRAVSLLTANVLLDNDNIAGLAALVKEANPDLFLAVETDRRWTDGLRKLLSYPHAIAEPLDNTYGMVLFSNLKLHNPRINYLIEEGIPSIHSRVELPSGDLVDLYCLHPQPPAPQESRQTTERDSELLLVGRKIADLGRPAIVLGDLNDVAWSYTTTLFQKTSHLLDPRRGRGMINSFHAQNPLLRFPLDHAFVSEDFKLVFIRRLPEFGSDHFPIFLKVVLDDNAADQQEKPKPDDGDNSVAQEKIAAGKEQGSAS